MSLALFQFLIRHRAAVIALAIVWAVAGIVVVARTPMDAVPDLSENQVLIFAEWPGQSPPEVERLVTRPLSLGLRGLDGVRSVRGSSDVGYSLIHVIFDDRVTFAEARRRVESQLVGIGREMPEGVSPRLAADGIPTGQIFWYTVEGTDASLADLRTLQDTVVAPQLRSVPGVAEVASVGGFVAEYQVAADAARLEAHGLTLAELTRALQSLAAPVEGQVLHKANTELLVRVVPPADRASNDAGASGDEPQPEETSSRRDWTRTLEAALIPRPGGRSVRVDQVARVSVGAAPRRGVYEKDGSEAVAGIVHLRYGHNPLEVTRAVKRRLREIAAGLPEGVRLVPCYDRTPLITGAVGTVTRTLVESLLVASLCVFLILRHARTSLVITLTLPLAILGTFLGMAGLRAVGAADVQTNIMSLAGIVVSIGVLVDASIVTAENVTHELRREFGDRPVTGDVSAIVARACATVGMPAFCSILIMIVSFLPVFALQGIDGRMYRPLAWTKTLALASVAVLTITLVPALCATFIRGRLRDESESALVRSVVTVYRPVLSWLLDRPVPLVAMLGATMILAAAATGIDLLVRGAVAGSVVAVALLSARRWIGIALAAGMILLGVFAQSAVRPIGLALRLPLDEGMVMDMPITMPRVAIAQAADDLKARNMVLCRFPEVQMAAGKAGRAETPFDPAPLDMIETMVEFRPRSCWPTRRLMPRDAERQARAVIAALSDTGLVEAPASPPALAAELVDAGMPRFDAVMREVAWQRQQPFAVELSRDLTRQLIAEFIDRLRSRGSLSHDVVEGDVLSLLSELPPGDIRRLGQAPDAGTVQTVLEGVQRELRHRGWIATDTGGGEPAVSGTTRLENGLRAVVGLDAVVLEEEFAALIRAEHLRRWSKHVTGLNVELRSRAAGTWTQVVCSELFARQPILDDALARTWKQVLEARYGSRSAASHHAGGHTGLPPLSKLPIIDPHPAYDAAVRRLTDDFARGLWLWPHDADSIARPGGEMDRSVQMPGWTNVWTRPIQNRVDMLATGVNSEVGVRVLGRDLDAVVRASEDIAAALRDVPGAADVIADPIRGKGYLEVRPDPRRAAAQGVALSDLQDSVQAAVTGRVICRLDDGDALRAVRLRIDGVLEEDEDSLRRLPVPRRIVAVPNIADERGKEPSPSSIPLELVADVRVTDGPATIKSEDGWLRNYVRLNVQSRDPTEFVAAARGAVAERVALPAGVFVEWTGQFEHAARTRSAILNLLPVVLGLIAVILYATYRDAADAGLMLLAVPGALAGGVLCQWLLGYPFSVAVGVGYIACFGMAAATGIMMLVYLRQAVEQAGGLERMTLEQLRAAVLQGAVHRLRPKLLTEATTILSLAPMLWSSGVGADVIRPMAAPVLGGLLIADEVIDLLLPVAFYALRRRRWRKLHASADDIAPRPQAALAAGESHP